MPCEEIKALKPVIKGKNYDRNFGTEVTWAQ